MKTQMFRVWALGVAIVSLALATGCDEEQAPAEVPDAAQLVPQLAPTDSTPLLANLEAEPEPVFVGAAAAAETTNVSTNVAVPKLVAKPVMPADLKVTPALAEVLKLAQAGVSDDVMLAYILHSTNFFDVTSDVIVYLNDLGVSNNVITTLIHHDTTPEMQARRQAAAAVQPLPANVVLNTPATNVYPAGVSQPVPASAPDSSAAPPPADAEVAHVSAPEDPVSVSHFYSSLAPYGTWVEVDGFGLAWQPTVVVSNPGWRPYCDRGRWIWTDCGWYWYSDYSWGWAPFHYGRWCDYPRLGWIWVPDTHWGPSWVSWRYSSSYCGWAPLPPACDYRPGFGFSYYGRSVGFSFDFGLGFHHYSYVPFSRFCDRSLGLHVLRGDRARVIHRETTVVNNYIVGDNNTIINRGIGRERVAAANRGSVPTARVRETPTRASTRREQLVSEGSSLAIVRPTLPPRPERSQVAVPPRSGITRVSSGDSQAAAPRTASLGGTVSTYTRPGVSRGNSAVVRDASPSASAATEPARPNRESRSTTPAASPSPRSLSPMFRSYARPTSERTEAAPQVAATPAPAPSRSSVSRLQSSPPAPVATIPAPAPTYTRASSTPSPAAPRAVTRNDPTFRSYARPNAVTPPPQVSRPAPSVSAPARPSYSRPEPSRSAPAVSAPARSAPAYTPPARSAPSFSPPARSAPSVSPSPSRSAPSYSRPSGGSSGGGRGVGRGRGD